jgi:hypothetical protein
MSSIPASHHPPPRMRVSPTPIRLPNGVVKHYSALQATAPPPTAAHPSKRLHSSTLTFPFKPGVMYVSRRSHVMEHFGESQARKPS